METKVKFPNANAFDPYDLGLKMFVTQGSTHSGPVLTPAEALIAIHKIDPEKEGIPLKKVGFLYHL